MESAPLPVTIGTPMVLSVFDDWYNVPFVKNSRKQVKRQSKQQKSPLVYQSSHVYQNCTNSVPIVKRQSNSKKLPLVCQSSHVNTVRPKHKAAQTPLPRETSITCAWAVATARRPWAIETQKMTMMYTFIVRRLSACCILC